MKEEERAGQVIDQRHVGSRVGSWVVTGEREVTGGVGNTRPPSPFIQTLHCHAYYRLAVMTRSGRSGAYLSSYPPRRPFTAAQSGHHLSAPTNGPRVGMKIPLKCLPLTTTRHATRSRIHTFLRQTISHSLQRVLNWNPTSTHIHLYPTHLLTRIACTLPPLLPAVVDHLGQLNARLSLLAAANQKQQCRRTTTASLRGSGACPRRCTR